MRRLGVGPQVMGPGDKVTVHAELELLNDTEGPVTMIGVEWRPIYADPQPVVQPQATERGAL